MVVYGQVTHPPTRHRLHFVFVPLKRWVLSVTRGCKVKVKPRRLLISEAFAKYSHVSVTRLCTVLSLQATGELYLDLSEQEDVPGHS